MSMKPVWIHNVHTNNGLSRVWNELTKIKLIHAKEYINFSKHCHGPPSSSLYGTRILNRFKAVHSSDTQWTEWHLHKLYSAQKWHWYWLFFNKTFNFHIPVAFLKYRNCILSCGTIYTVGTHLTMTTGTCFLTGCLNSISTDNLLSLIHICTT